jgi:uncharacterized glyoxalase superfamily protein PhnB
MSADDLNPTFYPGLLYRDADAAIAWLTSMLGFVEREVHREPDGGIVHAELELGSAVLMLSSAGIGREPFKSLSAGNTMVYVAVDEVDALFARAQEAGAEVAMPLTDTDYGSRDFTLRDPEGTLWSFGTYRPSLPD